MSKFRDQRFQQVLVIPITPQLDPAAVMSTTIPDDGLRQDMKQVVDLMKNLSLNLLSNVGNAQGHGRQGNQSNGEGG